MSDLLLELKAKREENSLLNEELSSLKAVVDELNEKNCECGTLIRDYYYATLFYTCYMLFRRWGNLGIFYPYTESPPLP